MCTEEAKFSEHHSLCSRRDVSGGDGCGECYRAARIEVAVLLAVCDELPLDVGGEFKRIYRQGYGDAVEQMLAIIHHWIDVRQKWMEQP